MTSDTTIKAARGHARRQLGRKLGLAGGAALSWMLGSMGASAEKVTAVPSGMPTLAATVGPTLPGRPTLVRPGALPNPPAAAGATRGSTSSAASGC